MPIADTLKADMSRVEQIEGQIQQLTAGETREKPAKPGTETRDGRERPYSFRAAVR